MTYATASINPFYAARNQRFAAPRPREPERPDKPVYARLPRAPITGSPVPHLTSLYHFHRAGEYGDRELARQLRRQPDQGPADLLQARPGVRPDDGQRHRRATCARNSASPAWPGTSIQGFDACDPKDFPPAEMFDFIWAHPPYWRQKLYADDPRDLSRTPTLEHFLRRYGQFIRNCRNALKRRRQAGHPHGRLFRPRGRIRPAGLPHQAPGLRRRA